MEAFEIKTFIKVDWSLRFDKNITFNIKEKDTFDEGIWGQACACAFIKGSCYDTSRIWRLWSYLEIWYNGHNRPLNTLHSLRVHKKLRCNSIKALLHVWIYRVQINHGWIKQYHNHKVCAEISQFIIRNVTCANIYISTICTKRCITWWYFDLI